MRILIFCIFFPSLITSPSSQIIKTVSQSFSVENFTSSIIAKLDGTVEVAFWDGELLKVETTIFDRSEKASEYALQYAINKGDYSLELSLTDDVDVMLLQPKKINRTIFRQGDQQQTEQTYKLFIPKRLQYSIQ